MFVQSTSYNRILLPDTEFLYDTGEGGAVTSGAGTAAASAPTPDAKPEPSTSRGTGRGKRKKADDEVGSL